MRSVLRRSSTANLSMTERIRWSSCQRKMPGSSCIAGVSRENYIYLIESGTALMRTTCKPEVCSLSQGKLSVYIHPRKEFCSDARLLFAHNAVISTLIDNIAGFCAWSTLDAYHRVSTVDLTVNYLQKMPLQKMLVNATVVNKTGNLIVVDVLCYDTSRTTKFAICQASFNIYGVKEPLGSVISQFAGSL